MNKEQLLDELRLKGFSEEILNAFNKIKRDNFLPKELKPYAYYNEALPLVNSSTISQPFTIAYMFNLLELKDNLKILEIGSGSGYVLALLNKLSKNSKIYGIELINELVEYSKKVIPKSIHVVGGDGSNGLKKEAPFDRILVSASFSKKPKHLFKQLKNNGILVSPVQDSIFQFKKINNRIKTKEFPGFVFVPVLQ